MCGIGGILFRETGRLPSQRHLSEMLSILRHRGPDDEGYFIEPGAGLLHCRLSIIDLSSNARQPMSNEDGTLWLVFNGEIYNYIELRERLTGLGHIFKSNSDSEVIIHAYEEYGYAVTLHLNGMFAFCIYDSTKKEAFIARDPFGIKPLYYSVTKEGLIFASEIKAILLFVESKVNAPGLLDYLTFQYVIGEKTMFKDIYRVMPATYMIIKEGKIKARQEYWSIGNIQKATEQSRPYERLRELLYNSVRRQIRSDVKLGGHLSGGIDTAIIAAQMRRLLPKDDIHTFTACFPQEAGIYDDSAYAAITSGHLNTLHHVIPLSHRDFMESFGKISYYLDEPVAAPGVFPQYYVSKLASQTVKVVLGGQGADEIFGGYVRYYIYLFERIINAAIYGRPSGLDISLSEIEPGLRQLRGYEGLFTDYFKGRPFKERPAMYYRLILRSSGAEGYLSDWIRDESVGYNPFEEYEGLFNSCNSDDVLNQVLEFECRAWLPALLQVEDRMSMACSIESRVPFLEREIAEFAFGLPSRIKIKDGIMKSALRESFKDQIPREIYERREKIGFPVPLFAWFKDELASDLKTLLPDGREIFDRAGIDKIISSGYSEHSRELWGIINIEMWLRNFFDRDLRIQ